MPDYLRAARDAGCEPAILEWLAAAQELVVHIPALQAADWAERRVGAHQLSDALAERFTLPGPSECTVIERRVPTRSGELTVMHYRPAVRGSRLAHVAFHGGGFILGSVREMVNDRLWRARAVAGGVDVFDVDYRLAPEHPFPSALDDGLDVLDWLLEHGAEFDIAPDRIGVGGTSAGGNLAALVAMHARDRGVSLDHQILEVPAGSLHAEHDESFRNYRDLADMGGDFSALRAAYLGGHSDTSGPAAPDEITDLAGLPATLLITAELDPLRDSGEIYAARLREADVPVQSWRAPGQLHGSGSLTKNSETARDWQNRVAEFLRSRVALSSAIAS
ncbi:alpha/beta hydrolase [Gordonia sp. CPCC 205515]|uniref:alpha/beta hydrolase n=1 Tax=Gordonia sp. CPCC 205515 TaxID=3140791 RepID=UPI003AF39C64